MMTSVYLDFLGNSLLWVATVSSLLSAIFSFQKQHLIARNFIFLTSSILLLASFYLVYQFLQNNFSFLYVAQNSNIFLPVYYKVSAFWGAHEGSFLLMILLLSLSMTISNYLIRNEGFIMQANVFASLICSVYLLFLTTASNPFYVLSNSPVNGADLNPLLQDPLLAIHPPLIFSGYVFYAMTFCFVISGAIGKFTKELFDTIKVWSTISWFTLSFGILLGSIWAYYELGWGGYWFWDPVENVSLMPWIAGTAFSHSLIFSRDKIMLSWMVFLAIITFLLSVFGSFIVRSGILNSVHSFAADPSRGVFLLAILALFTFASFIIYIRSSEIFRGKWPKFGSLNYLLLLNNIILMTILLVVLLGTLYPIFTEILFESKLSIGPNYFSDLITPLTVALIIVFTFEQFIRLRIKTTLLFSLIIVAICLTVYMFLEQAIFISLILVAALIAILLMRLISYLIVNNTKLRFHKLLGHFSVAILTFSILFNHNFSERIDIKISEGDSINLLDNEILFEEIEIINDSNFNGVRAKILINNDFYLHPEKRVYKVGGQITSETAVQTTLIKDYLVVLGDRFQDGSWSIGFSKKYGILLIWMSSFLLLFSILYGGIKRKL
ncbi:MAG: hypothetical protein CMD89_04180 [Gammaproteobacteria bacterium]|nr:hypothetical protein [Gammaproteobacteria bacterium]